MTDLRALLGDRYGIRTPAQLAHVLSEKLDDAAPLNVTRRWLPLAEELWERISLPDSLGGAWDRGADFVARHPGMSSEYIRAANPFNPTTRKD